MINSRLMMAITIQAGSAFSSIRQMSAEHTEACREADHKFSKFVTRYFLAIFPSRRSVRLAMINSASAIIRKVRFSPFCREKKHKKRNRGDAKRRHLFSKFISQLSYQIIFEVLPLRGHGRNRRTSAEHPALTKNQTIPFSASYEYVPKAFSICHFSLDHDTRHGLSYPRLSQRQISCSSMISSAVFMTSCGT